MNSTIVNTRPEAAQAQKIVLVVDDSPDNIMVLKEVLGEEYTLRVATSGAKALEICRGAVKPDIILLDIMMPGMDGYEVCARLKADAETAGIPVIFVTAMTDEQNEVKGLGMGAIDYITKPISPTIVIQRVRNHLELRAARLALEGLSRHYSAYLSPELVEGIRAGSIAGKIGSERKELTVMFSDIEDFTPKSERLGPEALTLALNSYFEAMARIVAKHHGTLDKFIGDSVMVFFGDPESLGLRQDAVACVAMALEMQAQIPLVVSEWKRLGIEETLDIRIGMSTGPCTVGNFGSSSQLTYTIFGKTVNLASRLESSGSPGKVVVSARTWELVSADFAGQALAPLSLKGMAQPTVAYEILGIRG